MTAPTEKFVDLDAALAEKRAKRIPLTTVLFGRKWELPGSVAAAVTLQVARWAADGLVDEDGEPVEGSMLTDAHYASLLADLVPGHILRQWYDLGLETDDIEDVFENLMKEYQAHSAKQGGGEGKGNRATRRSTTSSGTGRPSKRTA